MHHFCLAAAGEEADSLALDHIGIYVARAEAFIQLELVPAAKISSVLLQLTKLTGMPAAECPFCPAKFAYRESFEHHLARSHARYSGRVAFPGAREVTEIAYETLESGSKIKCPACDLFFPQMGQLVEHFDLESEQKLVCETCKNSRKNISTFSDSQVRVITYLLN